MEQVLGMVSMNGIRTIATGKAPAPGGHYAQGTVGAGLIFVSGQLPVLPDGTIAADRPFAGQARLALANMLAVVEAGGGSVDRIARVTAYIVGVANWPEFNRIYGELMGEARPARSVVPVPELHHGALLEIEAIAVAVRD